MTIKSTYVFWFLVALIAGAWPLALPTAQNSAPVQVSHAAKAVSPAA
jgi:hypothetical protein